MKVAIVFILLTTTTVKEKEACQDSRRSSRQQGRLRPFEIFHEHIPQSISSTDSEARAELFEIPKEERQWREDHAIPARAGTEYFSGQTQLDRNAEFLQATLSKDPFPDDDEVDPFLDAEDPFQDPDSECVQVATYAEYYRAVAGKDLSTQNSWDNFFAHISNCHMYPEDSDEILQKLLDDMFTLKIIRVQNFGGEKNQGTQIKLKLTFTNGKQALFKPMRFGIDYEKDPNQFYHSEMERANAEIAAFHLDKLLDFRRGVPTVHRILNITELKAKTPRNNGLEYFLSPGNNWCFVGKCKVYCDNSHAICGVGEMISGSVQAWLPAHEEYDERFKKPELYLDFEKSPYARTYTLKENAVWQTDGDYCKKNVTKRPEFATGRRLLDMVDLSILDFLTGNQDRHTFDTFSDLYLHPHFLPEALDVSFIIHLDNGRAFGNTRLDDEDILAPLIQCCVVRPSTVQTLLKFRNKGTPLGTELDKAMRRFDRARPILAQKYLTAINRRYEIVLEKIYECITKASVANEVLLNNFGGRPKFAKQLVRMTNAFVEPKKERGEKHPVIYPIGDQLRLLDMEIETDDEELTRQISDKNVETKERSDRFGQRQGVPAVVGHVRKIDRTMPNQELNEDLPRPPRNDSLWKFLIEILAEMPPGDYVSCPGEKTHREYLRDKRMEMDENIKWLEFYAEMSNCHLYKKDSQTVENVLEELRKMPIRNVTHVPRTADAWLSIRETLQLALNLKFVNLKEAIAKPMRFDRNYETNPNHFYFDDFERPNAEIAAFHLDRLLGFRRVPPTAGRALSIGVLLRKQLMGTRIGLIPFVSPEGILCLYSTMSTKYFIHHPYCGRKSTTAENVWLIDGSVQVWLKTLGGTRTDSPYKKTISQGDYTRTIKSKRTDGEYCDSVLKKEAPYNKGRLLLDLVDLHIFDFLTGNQERDHFNIFNFMDKNPAAFIFVTENGRAFGNPRVDDTTILAPLTQCCVVRPSTVLTLLEFYTADVSLGQRLDDSLKDETGVHPVLAKKHLIAINRRVELVLQEVQKCLQNAKEPGGAKTVLMNSFPNVRPWLPWFHGSRL